MKTHTPKWWSHASKHPLQQVECGGPETQRAQCSSSCYDTQQQYGLSHVTFLAVCPHTGNMHTLPPPRAEVTDSGTRGARRPFLHPSSWTVTLLMGAHVLEQMTELLRWRCNPSLINP